MPMLRLLLGTVVGVAGLEMLDRLGALELGFPLTMVALAPVALVSGLLMGLDREPPPWRRRVRG